MQGRSKKWVRLLLVPLLLALGLWAAHTAMGEPGPGVGSLDWTRATGGALSPGEKFNFVLDAVPGLSAATVRRIDPPPAEKVDASVFLPPDAPIVQAALARVKAHLDPAFVNHSIRTACWTLVVMRREQPQLSRQDIEEAWLAGLLHDLGLAETPPRGEFTLGGVAAMSELAAQFHWNGEATRRVSEAITLNPNSRVDRAQYGLLPWAMNVGGFGETFYGPYRVLMNPDNIRQLEILYPRTGFRARAGEVVSAEVRRFPDQRFELLGDIGFLMLMRAD